MEGTITMTPEIWTVLGTGFTLAALGSTGFTLLWRYVTRAEQRIEVRFKELKTDLKADLDTTIAEQKALGARMHTLESGDAAGIPDPLRTEIEGYNRDDCLSTLRLAAWLEERRREVVGPHRPARAARLALRDEEHDREQEPVVDTAALFEALTAGLPADDADLDGEHVESRAWTERSGRPRRSRGCGGTPDLGARRDRNRRLGAATTTRRCRFTYAVSSGSVLGVAKGVSFECRLTGVIRSGGYGNFADELRGFLAATLRFPRGRRRAVHPGVRGRVHHRIHRFHQRGELGLGAVLEHRHCVVLLGDFGVIHMASHYRKAAFQPSGDRCSRWPDQFRPPGQPAGTSGNSFLL